MKRMLSLVVTIFLLFTCIPSAFGEMETQITKITAQTVISGGQGVGYFDTSEAGTLETSSAAVVLREGEWAAYDISAFATAYYNVTLTVGIKDDANISLFIDNKEYTCDVSKTGSNTSFSARNVYNGLILSDASVLKIQNNGTNPFYFVRVQLEGTVSEENIIQYEDVIPGGEGIGYHDNGKRNDAYLGKLETSGKTVCLRDEEWTAYDISHLEKGNYALNVKRSSTSKTFFDVYVDSYIKIKDAELPPTGAYSTYTDVFLGVLHIDGNVNVLKIDNVGTGALYADYITLTRISDDYTVPEEIKYYGRSIFSKVEGEGFHDEAGLPATDGRVVTSTEFIMHKSDWAAYDISKVESGTYDVNVCVATNTKTVIDIFADGSKHVSCEIPATGTSYSTYKEVYAGKVYLEDAEKLKFLNSGSGSAYFRYFKLTLSSGGVNDIYEQTINPTEVIPGGQGVGFYDNVDIEPNNNGGLEAGFGGLVLRTTEWLKYDISNKIAGEYKIYITSSNKADATVKLTVDEGEQTKETTLLSTTDYLNYSDIYLGTLELDESSKTLKVENIGDSTVVLKNIMLKMIPIYESLSLTKDTQGLEIADKIAGSDIIYLTGEVKNVFYTANGIKVLSGFYDKEGRLLSLEQSVIDVKIGETENVSIPIYIDKEAAKMKVLTWVNIDRAEPLFSEHILFAGWDSHIYVDAEKGNDANSGESEMRPLKTLDAAQRKVQNMNDYMYGDIYVHLEGKFERENKLALTNEDSGSNGFNIIYDGGGKTTISGGKQITGFTKVEGTELYKTKVLNEDFRQLYVNGNRAKRARSKWLYFAKDEYRDDETWNHQNSDLDGFILAKEDFPNDFAMAEDMEFVWLPSWKNVRMPVESMTRNSDGDYVVTFPQPYFDSSLQADNTQPFPKKNIAFFVENAPEYLDEPGEWYYNKKTEELFYYPLASDNMETAEVYIPKSEMLLSVSGTEENRVENITLKGIEFKYGAWNRTTEKGFTTTQAEWMVYAENKADENSNYPSGLVPAQVRVDYGKNINIEDNKFSHLGSVALAMDNKTEGSKITGNVFDDISATAIMLSNPNLVVNSPVSDFVRNVEVSNNLIRRVSLEYMTPAITAYYVNNIKINHNDLLDCPYTGISLGWGWGRGIKNCTDNTVSNNRIENVLYKLKDGGHIYTLDTMRGTVFENNYMIKSGEWKGGVYLDNGTTGLTVRNNVFEDCERWLKLTWHNVINNTAYGNYSETDYGVTEEYLPANSIEKATGKTDGMWPEEALEIIENAGLSDEYQHMLTEYIQNTHFVNYELDRMPYMAKSGIIYPAGYVIPGGEGVAYHDIVSTVSGIGINDSYNGTGHRTIMSTSQGEWTKHSVDIPEDGTYKLYLCAAARSDQPRVSMWIDDVKVVDKGKIVNTLNYETYVDNLMATVPLTKGEHIVKVEHTVANFAFDSLRFLNVEDDESFDRNDGFVKELTDVIIAQ